jgi:hypothetical protein
MQVFAQEAEVGGAILVGRESLAAVDAPLGDMAGQTGENTAVAAWHMLKVRAAAGKSRINSK